MRCISTHVEPLAELPAHLPLVPTTRSRTGRGAGSRVFPSRDPRDHRVESVPCARRTRSSEQPAARCPGPGGYPASRYTESSTVVAYAGRERKPAESDPNRRSRRDLGDHGRMPRRTCSPSHRTCSSRVRGPCRRVRSTRSRSGCRARMPGASRRWARRISTPSGRSLHLRPSFPPPPSRPSGTAPLQLHRTVARTPALLS